MIAIGADHYSFYTGVIARVDRLDLDDKEEEERMRDSAEDWSSGDESLDGRS